MTYEQEPEVLDRDEREEIIAALFAAFPKQRAQEPGLALTFVAETLDFGLDELEAACRDLVRTAKWIPSIAELREKALALRVERTDAAHSRYLHENSGCSTGDDARELRRASPPMSGQEWKKYLPRRGAGPYG